MFSYCIYFGQQKIEVETLNDLINELLYMTENKDYVHIRDINYVVTFNDGQKVHEFIKSLDKQLFYKSDFNYKKQFMIRSLRHLHHNVIDSYIETKLSIGIWENNV